MTQVRQSTDKELIDALVAEFAPATLARMYLVAHRNSKVPPPPGVTEEEWRATPASEKATSSRASLPLTSAPEISRDVAASTIDWAELDHPERVCHRCGGPNVVWFAPSPLWNEVMRGGSINGPERFDGIVCPTCFAALAEEAEIAGGWLLSADSVYVELETTTPSGRVWDDETNRWEERP